MVEPEVNRDGKETGNYLVTAGERRRKALRLLAKRKRIKKTEPIPCFVKADGNPAEISLAENVIRASLHPADQFEAFQGLKDGDASVSRRSPRASGSPRPWSSSVSSWPQ